MAYTKTITKIMPTTDQIGVHLKLEDDDHPITVGTVVVIDEDITDNFSGDLTIANRNELAKQVQGKINEYKKNKAVYLKVAYTTGVTWINDNTTA